MEEIGNTIKRKDVSSETKAKNIHPRVFPITMHR